MEAVQGGKRGETIKVRDRIRVYQGERGARYIRDRGGGGVKRGCATQGGKGD